MADVCGFVLLDEAGQKLADVWGSTEDAEREKDKLENFLEEAVSIQTMASYRDGS